MKSLKFLNIDMCSIGYSHPVWVCGSDPLQATMAATKATLLVGRYPLTGYKCSGKKQLPLCPMCNCNQETIHHFLLHCPKLQEHGEPYMVQVGPILRQMKSPDPDDLVRCILEPSHYAVSEEDTLYYEGITRRMCYTLHNHRSILLGTGSMTARAIRRVKGRGPNKINRIHF